MEVYIEAIFINQWILHWLCYLSASIFMNQLINKKETLIYSILISLTSFNIYLNFPSILIYVYIFFIHLYQYKKDGFLFYFSYMVAYHFFVFIMLKIDPYSTYQYGLFIIYRTKNLISYFLLFGGISFCYFIHAFFLKRHLAIHQLIHSIRFVYRDKEYQLTGYLDTGNRASYKGIPIIFVKKDRVDFDGNTVFKVHTLHDSTHIMMSKITHLWIDETQYHEMYLAMVDDLDVPADCLLNVALLYKG